VRYGFFLIERVPRLWVKLPDGTTAAVAPDKSEDRVRAWWDAHVATALPEPTPEAEAAWEADYDEYRAATVVSEVQGTRGFSTEPVTLTQITYPDGYVDDRALGGTPDERIRRRYITQNPPPSQMAAHRTPDFDEWRRTAAVTVEPVTGWIAEFVDGEEQTDVELDATVWTQGFPAAAVAAALNQLGTEGWRVLHVSEDRGLYSGPHANSDAFVTRARYLLGREPA
jgi:hypothetical protein